MRKLTKIIATIGPATEDPTVIKELITAGMNIARFNTKHSDPEWHKERIKRIKDVAKEMNVPVGVLLDLQGPEIRINVPGDGKFKLEKGETATFTSDEKDTSEHTAHIPQNVIDSLSEGDIILLDDGNCEFSIVAKEGNAFEAQALHSCTVSHRKTMNTPGIVLDMPSLTDRDFQYLKGVDPKLVDFVGLSFVRNKKDVEILRQTMVEHGFHADIISKLENQAALDNLAEIIEVSDAIMIARGDLGVEVPFEELIYWQKEIIRQCRLAGKPVITATQMLKSMVDNPRPTRAEISDVAHAIYDSTDAIMLSEETTIGQYPVKAVATQTRIAEFNEPHVIHYELELFQDDPTGSITQAAVELLADSSQDFDKIVCLTETGSTARQLTRHRPDVPVYVVTSNEQTLQKLTILFGVKAFQIELPSDKLELQHTLIDQFKKIGVVQAGEKILLVYGTFWKKPGLTNSLSILDIPVES